MKPGWKTFSLLGCAGLATIGLVTCDGVQPRNLNDPTTDTPILLATVDPATTPTAITSPTGPETPEDDTATDDTLWWADRLVDEAEWRQRWEPVYGPVRHRHWTPIDTLVDTFDATFDGDITAEGLQGGQLVLSAADGLNELTQTVLVGPPELLSVIISANRWTDEFRNQPDTDNRCHSTAAIHRHRVAVATTMTSSWCHYDQQPLMNELATYILDGAP